LFFYNYCPVRSQNQFSVLRKKYLLSLTKSAFRTSTLSYTTSLIHSLFFSLVSSIIKYDVQGRTKGSTTAPPRRFRRFLSATPEVTILYLSKVATPLLEGHVWDWRTHSTGS